MALYHLRSCVVGKELPKAGGTVVANLAVKDQIHMPKTEIGTNIRG